MQFLTMASNIKELINMLSDPIHTHCGINATFIKINVGVCLIFNDGSGATHYYYQ